MTIKPNIFDYATSELSQDAVICWILSFYNDKTSRLYNLAKELLSKFVKLDDEDSKIEIIRQFYKTDILIHFPNTKKVLIIEDKTYTSEHDEQIAKYVETIASNDKYKECKINVVYFKTGFYDDSDKSVEDKYNNKSNENMSKFTAFHGEDFLTILQKYANIDATLDMYVEYLDNLIKSEQNDGVYYNINDENFWKWNISTKRIAQYKLMSDIFPKRDVYKIYSGSSFGRPWTEMRILDNVFWRIDTDNKGPYISLRYYNKYNKNSTEEKKVHIDEYNRYYKCVHESIKKYDEVGKQENYFEATLLHIHIRDVLLKWNESGDKFIEEIREITENFISNANNKK